MRTWRLVLIAALLSACATSPAQKVLTGPVVVLTAQDAASAQTVLLASASLLPPGDPWTSCMATIQTLTTVLQAGPGAPTACNADPNRQVPCFLTEAARLHVLDSLLSQASTSQAQAACAQIIMSIEIRAAAGATPGGALLPLR